MKFTKKLALLSLLLLSVALAVRGDLVGSGDEDTHPHTHDDDATHSDDHTHDEDTHPHTHDDDATHSDDHTHDEDTHPHSHGIPIVIRHDCGCEIEEYGLKLNCSDTAHLNAALTKLEANNCTNTENCVHGHDDTDEVEHCYKPFLIIQMHHDYCSHDDVSSELELAVHKYEESCGEGCIIQRKYNPDVPKCPTPTCNSKNDTSVTVDGTTYIAKDIEAALTKAGCSAGVSTSCTVPICKEIYLAMRAIHDRCKSSSILDFVEEHIHDYEDCKGFDEGCSVTTASYDPYQCGLGDDAAHGLVASLVIALASIVGLALV